MTLPRHHHPKSEFRSYYPLMAKVEQSKRGPKPRGGVAGIGVSVKFTPDEKETYQAAAEREELSLAEWIREACADRLKRSKRK